MKTMQSNKPRKNSHWRLEMQNCPISWRQSGKWEPRRTNSLLKWNATSCIIHCAKLTCRNSWKTNWIKK